VFIYYFSYLPASHLANSNNVPNTPTASSA